MTRFFLIASRIRALNCVVGLWSSRRFDCHSTSRASAICFMVRPVLAGSSSSLFEIRFSVAARLQDQPLILFTFAATDPHERPFAFRFFPIKKKVQLAFP